MKKNINFINRENKVKEETTLEDTIKVFTGNEIAEPIKAKQERRGRPTLKEKDKKVAISLRLNRELYFTTLALASLKGGIKFIDIIEAGIIDLAKKEDKEQLEKRIKEVMNFKNKYM